MPPITSLIAGAVGGERVLALVTTKRRIGREELYAYGQRRAAFTLRDHCRHNLRNVTGQILRRYIHDAIAVAQKTVASAAFKGELNVP
jgi:hypothetical protein